MDGKILGYVRISSFDQHLERQQKLISDYLQKNFQPLNLETDFQFFEEKLSGKSLDRPKFQELLRFMREGDTVIVESFSRISRSLKDLLSVIEIFEKKEVKLISIKENFILEKEDPTSKLFLHIIFALSQFELELTRQRQLEGVAAAKLRGAYKGRAKVKKPVNFDTLCDKYLKSTKENPYKFKDFQKEVGLKRTTIYKFMKEKKKNNSTS